MRGKACGLLFFIFFFSFPVYWKCRACKARAERGPGEAKGRGEGRGAQPDRPPGLALGGGTGALPREAEGPQELGFCHTASRRGEKMSTISVQIVIIKRKIRNGKEKKNKTQQLATSSATDHHHPRLEMQTGSIEVP